MGAAVEEEVKKPLSWSVSLTVAGVVGEETKLVEVNV
jgi:hypothetical protein